MAKTKTDVDATDTDDVNPFTVDENNLAAEWVAQPRYSRRAGRLEADARHAHATAKTRLDLCAASLLLDIRRNPEKYGLPVSPRANESVVDATVSLQPEHIRLTNELHDAKRLLDYRTADTIAFVDRRKGLERLVELLSLNYYAEMEPRATTPVARGTIDARKRRAVRGEPDDDK